MTCIYYSLSFPPLRHPRLHFHQQCRRGLHRGGRGRHTSQAARQGSRRQKRRCIAVTIVFGLQNLQMATHLLHAPTWPTNATRKQETKTKSFDLQNSKDPMPSCWQPAVYLDVLGRRSFHVAVTPVENRTPLRSNCLASEGDDPNFPQTARCGDALLLEKPSFLS